MTITSEPIYQALFELVSGSYAFVSKQRRKRNPDDIKAEQMPALFQWQLDDVTAPDMESKQYGLKEVSKDTLTVTLMVMAHSGVSNEFPTTLLNPIVDAIKSSFNVQGPPGLPHFQTLGGLVEYAVVSGTIEFYETTKSSSAMAIIPIKILAFN